MLLPSMYPAAPATIQPTARPTITDIFLRNGDPKSSVSIMLTNERNPSPINSGEPHLEPPSSVRLKTNKTNCKTYGSGFGAVISGHNWKGPDVGRLLQSFEPPPQLRIPEEPMSDAPIIRMTVPKTIEHKNQNFL